MAFATTVGLIFDAGVDNRNELDTLASKPISHSLWIRKAVGVESEIPICLHIVNIKMEHIERNIPPPVFAYHLCSNRLWIITPPALLVAECPHRRHRHVSGEVGIATEYFLNLGPSKEVIVYLAALRRKRSEAL